MTKAFPVLNDEAATANTLRMRHQARPFQFASGTVKVESKGSSLLSKELFWENPILASISFFQNRACEPIMVRTITATQLGVIYLTAMKPVLTLRYSQGNIKKPRLFMKGFW